MKINKITSKSEGGEAIYVTDIHGDKVFVEELLRNVKERKIKNVIIGGDIVASVDVAVKIHEKLNGTGAKREAYIKEFKAAHNFLIKKLLLEIGLFKSENEADFYLLQGNDDWFDQRILNIAERNEIIKNLHMKVHKLGNFFISGCSFVPFTPFDTNFEIDDADLYKKLLDLSELSDPKKTIYVIHSPPFGTALDVGGMLANLGSKSVRRFIEKYQPPLTLHGHIHESVSITGKWQTTIGDTIAINPGRNNGKFSSVIINMKEKKANESATKEKFDFEYLDYKL